MLLSRSLLTPNGRLHPPSPTIPQTNCKRTRAVYRETGEAGFSRDGRGLCTLTCECVCVCVFVCSHVPCVGWCPDAFTHAHVEKRVDRQHLSVVDVGVCCTLLLGVFFVCFGLFCFFGLFVFLFTSFCRDEAATEALKGTHAPGVMSSKDQSATSQWRRALRVM